MSEIDEKWLICLYNESCPFRLLSVDPLIYYSYTCKLQPKKNKEDKIIGYKPCTKKSCLLRVVGFWTDSINRTLKEAVKDVKDTLNKVSTEVK